MTDSHRFGTVTAVQPYRVRLDGESAAVDIDPANVFGPLVVGDRVACEVRGKSLVILGSVSAPVRDLWVRNMGLSFMGGGRRTASSTGIAWDTRFILMGNGRDSVLSPSGFIQLDKPADGTVIPVLNVNNQTSVSVASGVVPLAVWQTLWYDIAPSGQTFNSSRWNITGYDKPFVVPPTWIPVCRRNNDEGCVVWADGRETSWWTYPALGNSWANYGAGGYANARYKKENGLVHIQGLVKSGTLGSGGLFTLPVGMRPDGHLQWTTNSSGGVADIRLFSTGVFCVYALYTGTTASVSITVPPFFGDI